MSESIFETFTDERGNISVRISQEVQVLTREEANRIEAEYRRMQSENAKLRELVHIMAYCNQFGRDCDGCSMNGAAGIITERAGCDELLARLRELGVEVDACPRP